MSVPNDFKRTVSGNGTSTRSTKDQLEYNGTTWDSLVATITLTTYCLAHSTRHNHGLGDARFLTTLSTSVCLPLITYTVRRNTTSPSFLFESGPK